MTKSIHILRALRQCVVVPTAGLGAFFISTENFWGIFLGFTLVFAAFLFNATLRIEGRVLDKGRNI